MSTRIHNTTQQQKVLIMKSNKDNNAAKSSKVAKENKAVNMATCVALVWGMLIVGMKEALSNHTKYNKERIAQLYHALCAAMGIGRQHARTRINAYTGCIHKGKPTSWNNEQFIREAGRINEAGKHCDFTADSYSQIGKFDFANGGLPKSVIGGSNADKSRGELAVLLTSELAHTMFDEMKKDKVLGKLADKKITFDKVQKDLLGRLDKVA